jgi:hypothetical protein
MLDKKVGPSASSPGAGRDGAQAGMRLTRLEHEFGLTRIHILGSETPNNSSKVRYFPPASTKRGRVPLLRIGYERVDRFARALDADRTAARYAAGGTADGDLHSCSDRMEPMRPIRVLTNPNRETTNHSSPPLQRGPMAIKSKDALCDTWS